MCLGVYTYRCMYVCVNMYICVHVCMYVLMYICIHTRIPFPIPSIHIYIYLCINQTLSTIDAIEQVFIHIRSFDRLL